MYISHLCISLQNNIFHWIFCNIYVTHFSKKQLSLLVVRIKLIDGDQQNEKFFKHLVVYSLHTRISFVLFSNDFFKKMMWGS